MIFFMNINSQWDFIMGETCVQVSCFRDLVTVYGEPIRAGTVVTMWCTQFTHESRSMHKGKKKRNYRNNVCHKGT